MSNGRYRAYPRYKASAIDWIGTLPKDWEVSRIKFCASLNSSKTELNHLPRHTEVTFLPMEAIGEQGELDTSRTKMLSEVSSGYTYLAEGDVCIAKITPCFENGKGAIVRGLKNGLAFATTEVVPLRCQPENSPEFLYYLLTSAPFNKQAEGSMYGAGGQKRVADSFVANYHFAKPPIPEQTQIAKFLDHETAKIDRLIEKQEALIRLLKEKRQAVISHAVTKGLNPHAPLKDSGIAWLGQAPTHWGTTRLKYCTGLIVDCPHETPTYNPDGDYLVIRTADIDEGLLDEAQIYRVTESEYRNRIRRSALAQHDIVYGREGERWGHAALVPAAEKYCLGQRMMQFRAALEFDPIFLMWQLCSKTTYCQGDVDTVGATSPHVNVGTIRNFALTSPPPEEQQRIGLYLNQVTKRFDELMGNAESTITLLQERRTALISAAVTGKIDVRHWQPPATCAA